MKDLDFKPLPLREAVKNAGRRNLFAEMNLSKLTLGKRLEA